jgi:hypothetical protein
MCVLRMWRIHEYSLIAYHSTQSVSVVVSSRYYRVRDNYLCPQLRHIVLMMQSMYMHLPRYNIEIFDP